MKLFNWFFKNKDIRPVQLSPFHRTDCYKEVYLSVTTKNSYEAAYYLANGAVINDVKIRRVVENKQSKYGFRSQWILTLSQVKASNREAWMNGNATINVLDIERERKRIKRYIKSLHN